MGVLPGYKGSVTKHTPAMGASHRQGKSRLAGGVVPADRVEGQVNSF